MSVFRKILLSFCILVLSGVFLNTPVNSSEDFFSEEQPNEAYLEYERTTIPTLELLPEYELGTPDQLVINGRVVSRRYYSGVLLLQSPVPCTSSLIGPATILIAAHCLERSTRIRLSVGNISVAGLCEIAPTYNPVNYHNDWALCLLERRVNPRSVQYERVDLEMRPFTGANVSFTGYGCTVEGGGRDGLLRIGNSTVVPKPSRARRERSAIYTHSAVSTGDGGVLCPGDSGGPLFVMEGGDDDPRVIVGVNSRTTFQLGISIFSALADPAARAFFQDFISRTGAEVCGVNHEHGCN